MLLHRIKSGEVVEGCDNLRVCRSQGLPQNGEHTLVSAFCPGDLALDVIECGQDGEGHGDLWMLGTQHLFLEQQGALQEGLGTGPVAGLDGGGTPGTEVRRDEVSPCRWDKLCGLTVIGRGVGVRALHHL